jgi:hypothetical protein
MSSENDKEPKPIFESQFFSVILMLALIAMDVIFIIVIYQFYGTTPALNVLMYLGIGSAGGIAFTLIILGVFTKENASKGRNILLYSAAGFLFVSLLIAIILKFSIQDELISRTAFIDTNSIGLGITTGLAITYIILTLVKSKLIYGLPEVKQEENEADINIDLSEET